MPKQINFNQAAKGKYQLDHLRLHQEDYQLAEKPPPKTPAPT
ncbi:hypothetical protein PO124_28830 [Bacillus licheniformis]|nr:hypothetical protein [Bacillus licheniformis]